MSEHVKGVKELLAYFEEVSKVTEEATKRIVQRGSVLVESEVKKGFTLSHKRGTPTPSSPGEPPAVVTGTLRRSIKSDAPRPIPGGAAGRVYPTAIYSRIQELGGGFLPPRPYMAPGYERAKPGLQAIAIEEWKRRG